MFISPESMKIFCLEGREHLTPDIIATLEYVLAFLWVRNQPRADFYDQGLRGHALVVRPNVRHKRARGVMFLIEVDEADGTYWTCHVFVTHEDLNHDANMQLAYTEAGIIIDE